MKSKMKIKNKVETTVFQNRKRIVAKKHSKATSASDNFAGKRNSTRIKPHQQKTETKGSAVSVVTSLGDGKAITNLK